MKILFVTPGLTPPHGGYRVIFEVASRLLQFGHEITIHSLANDLCGWFSFPVGIHFARDYQPQRFDIAVFCSPHSIDLAARGDAPPRVVLFCQMLEHLFRPGSPYWQEKCGRFYASRHPLMAIARWNIDYIQKFKPFGSPIHYLGNGVNLEHFPIEETPKDGHTVLFEGWWSRNPAKDYPDCVGPKVALRLRAMGCRILAYSSKPVVLFEKVPHEFYQSPSLALINDLYRRATILVKATRYDARACAPVEAMTKGTVTARAITEGDDDLTPENSLRTPYAEEALFHVAQKLLSDPGLRNTLAANCIRHARQISWENQIHSFHDAIVGREEKIKTVIVSIVYEEPEWQKTKACIEACGVPVIYTPRQPPGVGSLAEAANRGLREALARYPDIQNIWLLTNVIFPPDTLFRLELTLARDSRYAMVHPVFNSDHAFCRPSPDLEVRGLHPVPFVELTAPLLRASIFSTVGPFDETMPYWGHDLDYGVRVRAHKFLLGVDHDTPISHVYLRHIAAQSAHPVTRRRVSLRIATDNATKARLVAKYGPDWSHVTGRQTRPGPPPPAAGTPFASVPAFARDA